MKIHLKQVPAQGLHLDGDEDYPIHDLEAEGIRCAGPLHYNIEVGIAGGALWARGSMSQPVELRCVSCLENFVHYIQVPAFAVHTELPGPRPLPHEPLSREDIFRILPAHPRCETDGNRVCQAKRSKAVEE